MRTICLDFGDGLGSGGHDWGLGSSMNSKVDYDLANGKHNGGSSGGSSGGRSIFWSVLVIIILAEITEGWVGVLATVIVLGGIVGIALLVVFLKRQAEKRY